MDEQTRALYQQLLGELYRRMKKDPEIRRALKRIEEGKATFRDTAVWSDRSAELLGTVFSEAIGNMPAEARESLCKALLRERYDSTFDLCGEVQEALDERLGISLQPVKPKFPAERVQQIAHSLLDPTVEASVIERRAGAPVATVSKSFHDDYIRENASARTDLGFKCYLDRIAAPGCCKWCTGVAGRYVYGSHPDDIFHRHDNCACTVTFENGRERQDVWSKRTWDAHDPKEIERLASRETVYTEEQAREIEENAVSGLTLAGKRDIITGRGSGTGSISGEHTFEKIGEVNPSDKKAVASLFAEFERQYQNSDIEHCRVITVSGEVYEVHGDRHTVNTTLLGDRMKGSTNEHNHVIGESQHSFSWEDLRDSADDGSKVVMAYDEKYRYYMIFPDKKIDSDAVYDAYERAKDSLGNDLIFNPERIQEGDEQHERIRRACEELGIEYSRREISR